MLCGLKTWQTLERVKHYKTSFIFDMNDILSCLANGFKSQRAKSSKKIKCICMSKGNITTDHWFFFVSLFFGAQVCTWIFVRVNDFGWRWFRIISSYAWGSTPGLGILLWKFYCNFSSQPALVFYITVAWWWADIWRRWLCLLRTDFTWLCDCYSLEMCDQFRSLLWTEVLR